jgi:hypothetical protein
MFYYNRFSLRVAENTGREMSVQEKVLVQCIASCYYVQEKVLVQNPVSCYNANAIYEGVVCGEDISGGGGRNI